MQQTNTFDARRLRNVLGSFTTGVTIITARDASGTEVGVTANSFNSVSLQPPLVLWSLAKSARSMPVFERAEHWAVHILSAGQEVLANRFAASGQDKFAGLAIQSGRAGLPLLSGCTARLQCKSVFHYEGGDHVIFVGEVLEFDDQNIAPLVYQWGKYAVAARKMDGVALSHPQAHRLDVGFDEDFLGYLLARAHFQFFARMSELMRRLDLNDEHLYILFGLSVKETRSIAELNSIMRPALQEVTPGALAVMCERELITVDGEDSGAILRLTELGHRVAVNAMAELKAIESDVLERLGYWNAAAFKNFLKQFIVETDIGVAHPWETQGAGVAPAA